MDDKLTSAITRYQVLKIVDGDGALVGQVCLAVESEKMVTLSFGSKFSREGLGCNHLRR